MCASSIILNLPKWFELELKDMLYTPETGLVPYNGNSTSTKEDIITIVDGTWLRYNNYYVNYYMHWTLFLITGVVPLGALAFFNLRIYLRLKSVRQIRSNTKQVFFDLFWVL